MATIAQSGDGRAIQAELDSFKLLSICCSGATAVSTELSRALRCSINWDEVLRLISRHRVLPAFHALCERDDVPASILSALAARFATHTTRVMRFSAELIRVLQHLEEHKIRAIAHKGPVMAQRLYGDPAMREFCDLDILIRSSDVPRAKAALRELGFTSNLVLSSRQEQEYLRTGYEFAFSSEKEPNLIELQWQLAPRFYAFNFEIDQLFERSVTVNFHHFPVHILRDEDLMLALCAHAAKHAWSQLGMLRDIAALARLELDWPWIELEARNFGLHRILLVSLELTSRLLGATIPEPFSDSPQLHGIRRSSLFNNLERNIHASTELETDGAYFRTMLDVRERRRDRVRFGLRLLTTPSVGEWQAVPLPDAVFPLYRAVRAWRVAKRLLRL